MVSNNSITDGLTDGIHLRNITTTTHTDADINVGKTLLAKKKNRLEHLVAKNLRPDELDRSTVQVDETLALLAKSNCNSGALPAKALNVLKLFLIVGSVDRDKKTRR